MAATFLAYVLKKWKDLLSSIEGLNVIYIPQASVEEAPKGLRRLHISTAEGLPLAQGGEPLLIFTRSALRNSQSLSSRFHHSYSPVTDPGVVKKYKSRYGECELQCIFISKDWTEIEDFELRYLTGFEPFSTSVLEVDFGEPFGKINYNLFWSSLDDLQVSVEGGIDTKALFFTCTIFGLFLYEELQDYKVIKEVDAFIKSYDTKYLIDVVTV